MPEVAGAIPVLAYHPGLVQIDPLPRTARKGRLITPDRIGYTRDASHEVT
jgi:hypothetical protein